MPKKAATKKPTNDTRIKKNSPTKEITSDNILEEIYINLKFKVEKQRTFVNLIKDKDMIICTGPAGVGKAQPLDSLILTPDGFKQMGEVGVGDYVITQDGTSTKIIGVFPQGNKEIFRIDFNDGSSTEVCKEHLWLTKTINERLYRKRERTTTGRIRVGETGKEGKVRTTEEINNTIRIGKRLNHSIPMVEAVHFNNKNTDLHPYLMGVLLGDGGLTKSVVVSTLDNQILERIASILPENISINKCGNTCDYLLSKNDNSYRNILKSHLRELKLYGLTSEDKFIPNDYLFNSVINRIELLRGLMDTDGYVNKNGTTVQYTTISKQLATNVITLVQSLGGVALISSKIPTYTYNGVKHKGKVAYTINLSLPPNINPFYISRKYDKIKPKTKYKPARFITNITSVGFKVAQCIMVNDPSRLYVTNDFIVTHNTYLTCAEAINQLKENELLEKIVLVKSVTTLKNEEIGYLKGGIKEKMEPFMYSFMNNFIKIIGYEKANKLEEFRLLEVLPIAYMRGINIDNAIVIIDETQNISIENIHTIMTRLGTNSKMIFLGDINQIDSKKKEESALKFLLEDFGDVEEIGVVEFTEEDIVRHPLVKKIEEIFKKKRDNM